MILIGLTVLTSLVALTATGLNLRASMHRTVREAQELSSLQLAYNKVAKSATNLESWAAEFERKTISGSQKGRDVANDRLDTDERIRISWSQNHDISEILRLVKSDRNLRATPSDGVLEVRNTKSDFVYFLRLSDAGAMVRSAKAITTYAEHFGSDLTRTIEHAAKIGAISVPQAEALRSWLAVTPASMVREARTISAIRELDQAALVAAFTKSSSRSPADY